MNLEHAMKLAAALLLVMTFSAQVVPVLPAGAAGGVRGPPANGDWVIQGTESYGSQDIHLRGNLVVSGSGFLELSDVNLYLDCTSDGQYGVFVQDGGTLSLKKDTIVTRGLGYNYTFAVTNGSRLWVIASAVHYCTP